MTLKVRRLMIGGALLALAACERSHGGATTAALPTTAPSDRALASIPLGAPPGQAAPLGGGVNNPFEGDAVAVEQGKALFSAMNCVYCHGAQGSGLMGPTLQGPGWRYGGAPAQIYNSIHDGRPKGMPAWGASLPPDQIWKLTAYIESLGGARPPATAAMAKIGADRPSTTGPQVADQVQTDTAHEAQVSAQHAAEPH
jgi:cytochrome c oxidase cbb3-type subunit 3